MFNQAVQADRNYSFLINVVLAGETAEISVLSNNLRLAYLASLQELIITTDQQVRYLKTVAIFSSIIGTLLAFMIALQISRNIRKPLQSITHTFGQLAEGVHLSEIPGTERADEIGKLANAANIFRQTNVRTQQLLLQTEEFSAKLQQREIDLRLAVQTAETASLAKSQFLANMSHELRTPMNAILGMLSLLQKTELSQQQLDYTAKTSGAAKLLLSILNDILDLSKAESGKMDLYNHEFHLDHLMSDISGILSNYIADKPIRLLIDIDKDVPRYLFGDPLRLQQILINLAGNAIKFTEQGSVVIAITHHATSAERANLTFRIKDTGIGIAPEHQEKIFAGFTQAEGSITRRFGGTGLGLAISKTLVELMGGQLSLKSELGCGSEFIFSIDIPQLSVADIEIFELNQQLHTRESDQARLPSLKILLVEDNLINQQIAVELLADEGANISVANNGQEALAILQHNLRETNSANIDVILMDLQMPIMDGFTATQKIRTELQLVNLPIIAMTANAMASDREACLKAGMNDHIGKPFDLQQLITVICEHIGDNSQATKPTTTALNTEHHTDETKYSDIDLADAITRMGGNHSFYVKILPLFRKLLAELPTQLTTLAATNDMATIIRELHSFKGLSATMGANTLSQEIAHIEKTLKQDPQHPESRQLIHNACRLITNSVAGFNAVAAQLALEQDKNTTDTVPHSMNS